MQYSRVVGGGLRENAGPRMAAVLDARSGIVTSLSAWAIVREARALAGLTQRALAARAGTTQAVISRIEGGREDPAFGTLERIVRACDLDLRIRLAPHDDHDDGLIEGMLALTPDERVARLEEHSDFLASARVLGDRA
jgi:transcriptional regulator with XRE-family HTH domain